MNIKKGDNVKMLAGRDRGKIGKVLSVSPRDEAIVVEGLNLVKRHQRPRRQGQKGQIISRESATHISNVMLVCPKCGKPTRVGHKTNGDDKTRVCKKCGGEI